MRQGRTLYRRVAGVEPNDAQVTEPKSVDRLWRSLPSSSGLVETKDHSQKGGRSLCILMHQRRTLYRRVAGAVPNDVQVTESKSVKRLWRNLPSSSGLLETKDHSQKGGELHEY